MPPAKKGSDNRDVLSSLPRSRPQRPSARREKARAAAKPAAEGAMPKAAAKRAAAKPKATAAAAKAAAGPRVPRGRSDVPPAGYAAPEAGNAAGPPSGAELISTAVQAAGELVQIGATLGGQALKSALSRLPKP